MAEPWQTPRSLSGCGVLGIVRKKGAPPISSREAVSAIECVRFRGSAYGAGFAAFRLNGARKPPYRLQFFVDSPARASEVAGTLRQRGVKLHGDGQTRFPREGRSGSWTVEAEASEADLYNAVHAVNEAGYSGGVLRARAYSWGRHVEVFKEVGYPADVARLCGLEGAGECEADLWLAHTRQPTNSPGRCPIWSHPFAAFETAIVHNGDISSFGANMRYLEARAIRSFVGTDSEVIAYLLDHLLRVHHRTPQEAGLILTNPYEHWPDRFADEGQARRLLDLLLHHRGAQLDGPFTALAGHCDGRDLHLLALVDRSKFRPVVVGEDEGRVYIASEEAQIRLLSPKARVWTPEPGRFVLATMNRGVVEAGRERREHLFGPYDGPPARTNGGPVIDATGKDYRALNDAVKAAFASGAKEVTVKSALGQRYLGVGAPKGGRLVIHGYPGNCLGNYNPGVEIVVHGNGADDIGDAMHAGRIVIHGDARDVCGQALQGGDIFVRGSVGNRAAIQMRQYEGAPPFLIAGGRADDYFGEYMAGGVAVVLGLKPLEAGVETQLVGDFAGTGMVGGRIYIRGRVRSESIGLPPARADVESYLELLHRDGELQDDLYHRLRGDPLNYELMRTALDPPLFARIRKLFENKYYAPLKVQYRTLDEQDRALLGPKLEEYWSVLGLERKLLDRVLEERFTVLFPEKRGPQSPVPKVEKAEEG